MTSPAPVPDVLRDVTFLLPARLLAPGIKDVALQYSTTPADVVPEFRGRNAAVALD